MNCATNQEMQAPLFTLAGTHLANATIRAPYRGAEMD